MLMTLDEIEWERDKEIENGEMSLDDEHRQIEGSA